MIRLPLSALLMIRPRVFHLALRSFHPCTPSFGGPHILPTMNPPLSREELRAKRLRALLGGVGGDDAASMLPTTTNAAENRPSSKSVAAGPPRARSPSPRNSAPEVIDLSFTDSSDDEDVSEPQPKRSKKAPAKGAVPRRAGGSTPTSRRKRGGGESGASTQVSRNAAAQPSVFSSAFQVVSWNVWFGPPNGSNPHVRARMSEMARILRNCDSGSQPVGSASPFPPLWFVGFQEVTEEARVVLEKSLPEYKFVRQPGYAPYYCMLGVRQRESGIDPILLESGCVDYHRTACGRAFCYARVRLPFPSTTQVLVATTHLESYCGKEYTGHMERPIQLRQFESFAQEQFGRHPQLRTCLLMGDYNWDDDSKSAQLDEKTDRVLSMPNSDVWLQYRSQDPSRTKDTCYTYDGPRNPMLGNRLRRRFDRCVALCQEADQLPRTTRVELLGTTELPGLTWDKVNSFTGAVRESPTMISDHYGLLASLTLE